MAAPVPDVRRGRIPLRVSWGDGLACFCAFEPSLFQIGGEHFRRRWQLVVRPLEPRFGAVLRNTSVRAADSFDCRLRNTGAMIVAALRHERARVAPVPTARVADPSS